MSLIIRRVDFAKKRVTVALAAESPEYSLKRLPSFVARCERVGFVVDFVREVDERPSEYSTVLEADAFAPHRIGKFALIVGIANELGANSLSRLRLAVYELAVNSVEHGNFGSSPRIRLKLSVDGQDVRVSYEDNAASFETVRGKPLDIQEKINRGDKRGLGLFLLERMADDLTWDRVGGWNRTTFRLVGHDSRALT